MPQPEPDAITVASIGRQIAVTHQRAEYHLELLLAESMRLSRQHPIACDEVTGL
jgi:hypothetical protein